MIYKIFQIQNQQTVSPVYTKCILSPAESGWWQGLLSLPSFVQGKATDIVNVLSTLHAKKFHSE